MKKQVKRGFTLVELLVVISIIGMLAGLLLPAVNAAREAGRRATCVSNQSNVALALLNYESARGQFPPMKVYLQGVVSSDGADTLSVSWVSMILANMEFNTAWAQLSSGTFSGIYDLTLPIMRCKSATEFTDSLQINYVVNGGYQNVVGATASPTLAGGTYKGYIYDPGRKSDAVFFDHTAAQSGESLCKAGVSVDYISSHAGTGYVLLLSENVNAGRWIGNKTLGSGAGVADACIPGEAEPELAFTYPYNENDDGTSTSGNSLVSGSVTTGEGEDEVTTTTFASMVSNFNIAPGTKDSLFPFFINVRRTDLSGEARQRTARPSSNHPGIAVAAFADRSVRPLSEFMDRGVFIRICQPNSGVVINPNDL